MASGCAVDASLADSPVLALSGRDWWRKVSGGPAARIPLSPVRPRRLARLYWSTTLLALLAVLLLYLGDVNKAAVAGAGFALAGAAAARFLDIALKRREEMAQEIQRRREELDETRRLAYMALIVGATISPRSPELVATIVNALAHHGAGVDPTEAANHVAAVIYGDKDESAAWLQAQIDRITAEHGRLETIR